MVSTKIKLGIVILNSVITEFSQSIKGQRNPIVLVHGVYGSGKSFVLSVLIIILYRAVNASLLEVDTRIVVSSMTNVAVDRILTTLLEMGFDDFVRVGSLKKIAKSILPFTCLYKNESQGIKELQEMLDDDSMSEDDRDRTFN